MGVLVVMKSNDPAHLHPSRRIRICLFCLDFLSPTSLLAEEKLMKNAHVCSFPLVVNIL